MDTNATIDPRQPHGDAERYACQRIDRLTRALVASLTPMTLAGIGNDLADHINGPDVPSADLVWFAAQIKQQLAALVEAE